MPEGDTIYRTATALRAALLGKPLVSFDAPRHRGLVPRANAVVERVASHGKHIEIGFDDGVVLHTHMRMTGSWHLYRTGEHWRRSVSQMRVSLEVAGWKAVCFNAPVVEVYRSRETTRHPLLGSLGPDLARADADILECVARIERFVYEGTTVAEVLLDQRVACGVGNVYKSEVLWACELHPSTPIEALSIDQRYRLIELASTMLRANLDHTARITTTDAPGGLAVYGRTGKPCLRCAQPVQVRKHGEQARVTYFCASCQLLLGRPDATLPPEELGSTLPEGAIDDVAWAGEDDEVEVVDDGDGGGSEPPSARRSVVDRTPRRTDVSRPPSRPLRYVDPLLARRAASE